MSKNQNANRLSQSLHSLTESFRIKFFVLFCHNSLLPRSNFVSIRFVHFCYVTQVFISAFVCVCVYVCLCVYLRSLAWYISAKGHRQLTTSKNDELFDLILLIFEENRRNDLERSNVNWKQLHARRTLNIRNLGISIFGFDIALIFQVFYYQVLFIESEIQTEKDYNITYDRTIVRYYMLTIRNKYK